MSDNSQPSELAFMLGRIQGDVKHILEAMQRNQQQFHAIDDKFTRIDERLDKVEKFNVKVITTVGILGPIFMAGLQVAMAYFGF